MTSLKSLGVEPSYFCSEFELTDFDQPGASCTVLQLLLVMVYQLPYSNGFEAKAILLLLMMVC